MVYVIHQRGDKVLSLPARLSDPKEISKATSTLAWKILKLLAEKPSYPKEIAKKLKVHEQKVYYHIRNLERVRLVEKISEQAKHGALAKIYTLRDPALVLPFKKFMPASKLIETKPSHQHFLEPFIEAGKLNARVIVGSPEPHGQSRARARDGPEASLIMLFLGTFISKLNENPILIDTQTKESDLKNNLILIGGPRVNAVAAKINNRLPIRFQPFKKQSSYYLGIYSSASDKIYSEEEGIILKAKNPFDKKKEILFIGGKGKFGTRAAVLALVKKFDEICTPNKFDEHLCGHVVEGIDRDSDGVIDDVEILE